MIKVGTLLPLLQVVGRASLMKLPVPNYSDREPKPKLNLKTAIPTSYHQVNRTMDTNPWRLPDFSLEDTDRKCAISVLHRKNIPNMR